MTGKRNNGEGSIYPYKNGHAAYVWVDTPDGGRKRKYVYGKTRDEVHDKWIKLHTEARKGPVATRHRTLDAFLSYWLESIVKPNLAPLTYVSYEGSVRLYISPHLGAKRLDKVTVRDVREWLTKLAGICQCCAQGKDAKRPAARRRCCAKGECCGSYPSRRVIQAARDALRAALTHAVTEEEIGKNVASLVKVPKPRRRRIKPWSVAEAGAFLADGLTREDPLFAAWVLVLCLGLRRGEVLGLTWKSIDFDSSELYVDHQIQRAGKQILHRETKTEESDDFLPLPGLCLKALRMRRAQQDGDRKAAGELWQDVHGLVFTTKYGTPIEPGNLTRMFALRARRAGLRVIPLRNTRHTCSSLLVALKVHPKVAQRILRHSQIAMTMEIYAEASEEEKKRCATRYANSRRPWARPDRGGFRTSYARGSRVISGGLGASGLMSERWVLLRERITDEFHAPLIAGPQPFEVAASLGQTQPAIGSASHLVRVVVVLAVVVPEAHWTDLVIAALAERDVRAARTLVRTVFRSASNVDEGHAAILQEVSAALRQLLEAMGRS